MTAPNDDISNKADRGGGGTDNTIGIAANLVSTSFNDPSRWTNILPDANYLRYYEEILPGAADRILRMVEVERGLEAGQVRSRQFTTVVRYLLTTLMATFFFGVGVYLVIRHFMTGEVAFAGFTIVTLFVLQRTLQIVHIPNPGRGYERKAPSRKNETDD